MEGVVGIVLPLYQRELSATEERTIGNIVILLNKNSVSDEVVRSRILAKSKAFLRDIFNAGVENNMF